ncbi:MAG: hypothetical protein HY238_22110 [Acidobacteria bacterium]|nr:hypothetical protein [Acidobacteriota bacterium]
MAVYEEVKRALQDIMAPQLAEIRGEMRTGFAELRAEMDSQFAEVRSEIAQLRSEMRQEINNLHTDLVRVEQVLNARLQSFELVERVVRLEERVGAFKQAPAG